MDALCVWFAMLNKKTKMMKNLELINESIQKMVDKPSEGAIIAAQSIARVIDDALVNKYKIEWKCLPIQGSETVDVANATNKPSFVCRFYDEDMWNEVSNMFCDIGDETEANQMELFSDLIDKMEKIYKNNQVDK